MLLRVSMIGDGMSHVAIFGLVEDAIVEIEGFEEKFCYAKAIVSRRKGSRDGYDDVD